MSFNNPKSPNNEFLNSSEEEEEDEISQNIPSEIGSIKF
jgi:hypothetical protein